MSQLVYFARHLELFLKKGLDLLLSSTVLIQLEVLNVDNVQVPWAIAILQPFTSTLVLFP